jgi:hypothetical protein
MIPAKKLATEIARKLAMDSAHIPVIANLIEPEIVVELQIWDGALKIALAEVKRMHENYNR